MRKIESSRMIPANSSPFINFPDGEGIYLLKSEGVNYAVLDQGVPYPDPQSVPELQSMLLPEREIEGKRALELPENFATLGHALNDVTRDTAADRGVKIATELFESVGTALAEVAMRGQVVPPAISYKNIIFSREEEGPKLLPPIEFVKFQPNVKEVAIQQVIRALRKSLEAGAAGIAQKQHSMRAFGGFVQNFDW